MTDLAKTGKQVFEFKKFFENAPLGKDKLIVFDFDDTLVFTPRPEEGIPKYEAMTGKSWTSPEYVWWDKKIYSEASGEIQGFSPF